MESGAPISAGGGVGYSDLTKYYIRISDNVLASEIHVILIQAEPPLWPWSLARGKAKVNLSVWEIFLSVPPSMLPLESGVEEFIAVFGCLWGVGATAFPPYVPSSCKSHQQSLLHYNKNNPYVISLWISMIRISSYLHRLVLPKCRLLFQSVCFCFVQWYKRVSELCSLKPTLLHISIKKETNKQTNNQNRWWAWVKSFLVPSNCLPLRPPSPKHVLVQLNSNAINSG